jgi:hypothetical protein
MKSEESYLAELLKILEKENCPDDGVQIKEAFCLCKKEEDSEAISTFSDIELFSVMAMQNLKNNHKRAFIKEDEKFKQFDKKIRKLSKAHKKFFDVISDPEVKEFYRLQEVQSSDDTPFQEYISLCKQMSKMGAALEMFLYDPKSKQGDASLKPLYNYVHAVACFYEELTGLSFKSNRPPKENGQYKPITKSQDFIWKAVELMHWKAKNQDNIDYEYSSENILNACENASKRLKSRARANSEE